jgi:hypothetical protein
MGEIKGIEISIRPEYIYEKSGPPIMRCQIRVKIFGTDEIVKTRLIPNIDFQSRFSWFVEAAMQEIKNELIALYCR